MIPDRILVLAAAATLSLAPAASAQSRGIPATYRAAADSLIRAATRDSAAYDRVGRLVDGFGHRLAGSRSLEAAIDWILQEMKRDGLENVRGEPVAVAHWVRGEESVVLVRPRRDTLGMPGLGLEVDGERYFWYHHSDGDTLDKLDPAEVARCVAAMAVMAYVIADLPEGLPRSR